MGCARLSGKLANLEVFTQNPADFVSGDLMTRFQTGISTYTRLLAVAFLATLCSTPTSAYTPDQQQACTNDAFRLCSADIPDVDRITACMIRNKSQLSPECRAHFGPDPSETARPRKSGRQG